MDGNRSCSMHDSHHFQGNLINDVSLPPEALGSGYGFGFGPAAGSVPRTSFAYSSVDASGSGFRTGHGLTNDSYPSFGPNLHDGSPSINDASSHSGARTRSTYVTCGATFGRSKDLERHARKHQSGSNTYRCTTVGCSYSSYRKDKLADHIRRSHRTQGNGTNV